MHSKRNSGTWLVFFLLFFLPVLSLHSERLQWHYTASGAVPAFPLIMDGSREAVFHADNRRIYILDTVTGQIRHQFQTGLRPGNSLQTFSSGDFLLQLYSGGLARYSLKKGVQWLSQPRISVPQLQFSDLYPFRMFYEPVQASNGYVLQFDRSGIIRAFNPRGHFLWSVQLDSEISGQPIAWQGGALVPSPEGLLSWVAWDGTTSRFTDFTAPLESLSRLYNDRIAAAIALPENRSGVAVLDSQAGVRAAMETESPVLSVSAASSSAYGSASVLIHTADGIILWLYEEGREIKHAVAGDFAVPASDGTVYVARKSGRIMQLDPRYGILWETRLPGGAEIQGIQLLGTGGLLVQDNQWTQFFYDAPAAIARILPSLDRGISRHADYEIFRAQIADTPNQGARNFVERVEERLDGNRAAGRIDGYSELLKQVVTSGAGIDPRIREQAVMLLGRIGGSRQAQFLVELAAREQNAKVLGAVFRSYGDSAVDSSGLANVQQLIQRESRQRRDSAVAGGALSLLRSIQPYIAETDMPIAKAICQEILENAYIPALRYAASDLLRELSSGFLQENRLR
ncbi:HEAT repeat domain-containing protein [Spirochaeta dissipatitropha]